LNEEKKEKKKERKKEKIFQVLNNSVIYTIQTASAFDLTILTIKKWIRHKLIGFRCNVSYLNLSRLNHS